MQRCPVCRHCANCVYKQKKKIPLVKSLTTINDLKKRRERLKESCDICSMPLDQVYQCTSPDNCEEGSLCYSHAV